MRRLLLAVLALLGLTQAAVAAEQVRFVSCPIYRDTDVGRKSGCWLSDDRENGVRYDISMAPTKPDWNRAVLVEGIASAQPDVCGGVVLEPARVSVLDMPCPRALLPAEEHKGRKFVLPARNVPPLYAPRTAPTPPFQPRTAHIPFDFDSDYIVYQLSDYLLNEAIVYGKAIDAARYIVTGYAATEPEKVSGVTLAERPEVARLRAEKIKAWLVGFGVPADRITLKTQTRAKPIAMEESDGLTESSRRRATLEIIPQGAR